MDLSPALSSSHHQLPPSDPSIVDLPPSPSASSNVPQPQPIRNRRSTPTSLNFQPSSLISTTHSASSHHPSKTVLTIALAKAQTAVQLDTALQIPEAIQAYTEAVLLLEEVIDKIDASSKEREQKEYDDLLRDQARDKLWTDELWNRVSRDNVSESDRDELQVRLRERERKWREKQWKMEKRQKARADEEDRLIGIHNTYAGRIAELQAEMLSGRFPSNQSLLPSASSAPGWSNVGDQQSLPPLDLSEDARRRSFSSESINRHEGVHSESLRLSLSHQDIHLDPSSTTEELSQESHEIAEEEKDVVSERLPLYNASQLHNHRPRPSSLNPPTGLSQLVRSHSNESILTPKTSIATVYKPDQSLPTILQTPTESSFQLLESSDRPPIVDMAPSSHSRSTSRHSIRRSDSTSARSDSPTSSNVPQSSRSNQDLNSQSPRRLLVSETTTHGTISQRRRSPSSLGSTRSLSRAFDRRELGTTSTLQPTASASLDTTLGLIHQAAGPSMSRRPSDFSVIGTVDPTGTPLRLRSYSQPGKRPGLPSFIADGTTPLPNPLVSLQASVHSIPRKSSVSNGVVINTLDPTSPNPASSLIASAHHPSTMSSSPSSHPSITESMTRSETPHRNSIAPTTYGIQPYAHASISAGSIYSNGTLTPVGTVPAYPASLSRRPFYLMRQIRNSISSGAYVSPRLYVPRQMWYQVQVKLHGLETKIKLMDTLLAGLELLERDGLALIGSDLHSKEDGREIGEGRNSKAPIPSQVLSLTERFLKRLEIFEELLDNLQAGGAKKLGLWGNGLQETAYGQDTMRKGSGFGTLMAHKLGKGLDRITQGRSNTDLPTLYVDTIARLFDKSQTIDAHLASLDLAARSQGNYSVSGLYHVVGQQPKQHIEGRLRRVSEFYSTVVCRFVVADMGILLDKYVKRGGNWCGD